MEEQCINSNVIKLSQKYLKVIIIRCDINYLAYFRPKRKRESLCYPELAFSCIVRLIGWLLLYLEGVCQKLQTLF